MAEEILIADDDRDLARLLTTYLRGRGFKVAHTLDAVQTIMAARRAPPAAILLDVHIPGGSGLDVLKQLKASARTSMIPVIVISASTDPQLPPLVVDLGAEEFQSKPFDFDQIYRALCQLLGKEIDASVEATPAPAPAAAGAVKPAVEPAESEAEQRERRKNLRITTRGWVLAEYAGQQLPVGNLSITGVFVLMENPPEAGTNVELRLMSPQVVESIELGGVVRRSRPGHGMGVQFADAPGLARFLNQVRTLTSR